MAALAAPLIAQLAGMALGKLFGGETKEQKAAREAQTRLQQTQQSALTQGIGTATELTPRATSLLDLSGDAFKPATDYWSRILAGDTKEAATILAPEAAGISSAYTQAGKEASMLMPRGGYRSMTLANLPFAKASKIGDLFASLRPTAATNLADIGTKRGALGSSLIDSIMRMLGGAGAGAGSTGASLLSNALATRQQQYAMGKDIGQSIYNMLKLIPGWSGKTRGNTNPFQSDPEYR